MERHQQDESVGDWCAASERTSIGKTSVSQIHLGGLLQCNPNLNPRRASETGPNDTHAHLEEEMDVAGGFKNRSTMRRGTCINKGEHLMSIRG